MVTLEINEERKMKVTPLVEMSPKRKKRNGFHATPMEIGGFSLTPTPIVKSESHKRNKVKSDVNIKRGGIGLVDISLKGSVGRAEVLPDKSGLPSCSREQQQYYEQNWENILDPKMIEHLRGSEDVLHGGRSLNMLFDASPSDRLYRESLDWDLLSKKPRKHSIKLEKQIDKSMGCNICDVTHVPIPITSDRDYEDMSADLYRVSTPYTNKDSEIDIMDRPKKLDTIRYNKIHHETLESQYKKVTRGLMVPMRSFKSGLDRTRIREYYRLKGKKLKV